MAATKKRRYNNGLRRFRRGLNLSIPSGLFRHIMLEQRTMRLLWKSPLLNIEAIAEYPKLRRKDDPAPPRACHSGGGAPESSPRGNSQSNNHSKQNQDQSLSQEGALPQPAGFRGPLIPGMTPRQNDTTPPRQNVKTPKPRPARRIKGGRS